MKINPFSTLRNLPKVFCAALLILAAAPVAVAAPVVHWKMDETSGITLGDSSGNGIEGIWSGASAQAGWLPAGGVDGGAVSFSGITGDNDYFLAPIDSIQDYPVTLSVWVKTVSTQNDGVLYLGDGSATATYKVLRVESNLGRMCIRAGGTENKIAGSFPINDNAWHHVVGVYVSASRRDLYIDGQFAASSTANYNTIPMNRLGIGALTRSNVADLYTGLIDEVSVWNEVLEPREIAALHALGAARGGNASHLESYLAAFDAEADVTTGPRSWTFATNLTGPVGTLSGSLTEGDLAVVLDENAGTGMKIVGAVAAPVIVAFTAEPDAIISGEPTELSWTINDAVSAVIDPGNITVSPTSGTLTVSPGVSRTYTLTAVNPNGTADRSVLVTVDVPRRLQLHWPLDEAAGTAVDDAAGSFTGSFIGLLPPEWTTPGFMGSSLTFFGQEGTAVRAAAQVIEGYPFSFGGWIRTENSGTDTLAALGTGVDTQYHALSVIDGVARLTARNGVLTFNLNGPSVNDGEWHLITGVFASRQVRTLYVDGVQAATISDDSHGILDADRFSIGALDASDSAIINPFTGQMDDVAFWRGILSADDVAALHGAGRGLGLNAGETARLLTGYDLGAPVTLRGFEWQPVSGLNGAAGETSGSLETGDAAIVMDQAGGGMAIEGAPAVEDFRIISVSFDAANRSMSLTWLSSPGAAYRVEASASADEWEIIAPAVAGAGAQTTFTETNIPANFTKRFYQVRRMN